METFVYMGFFSIFKIAVSFNHGFVVCLESSSTRMWINRKKDVFI